jgi:NADPH:quinone reductase-like Zn-dependent oxidoreductase
LLPLQEPAVLGFETAGVVDAIGGELSGSVVGRNLLVNGGTV